MKTVLVTGGALRLGALLSVTGNPANGLTAQVGYKMAVDEINERGGVLGRPLELIVEDDGSLPDTAVPAARRLIHVASATS